MNAVGIFWHRRDLRIEDNAGLYKALKSGLSIVPIFIFDSNILDELPADDQRVLFIHQEIEKLQKAYRSIGSDLTVFHGTPQEVFEKLTNKWTVKKVFTNRDYEPYAKDRDQAIYSLLKERNIEFVGAKDHVIFEKDEVLKNDGMPYTVFTPYANKWRATLTAFHLKSYPTQKYSDALASIDAPELMSLDALGFEGNQKVTFPTPTWQTSTLQEYTEKRDFPAQEGTSRLSVHLRFGTISIRVLARDAQKHNASFLNELIWRDFYQMIVYHFPESVEHNFKRKYDAVPWRNNKAEFELWCAGKTGYPLVDAGMRELNETGFMHNRVRMVVASFLTKHLLIDWRWGESYFAEKLLDFEFSSNVGGWQWAAGTGCDAAPYFRVFNPESQLKKFDPQEKYTRRWVPEWKTADYPEPMVEHKMARERAINTYKDALK